MKSFETSGMFVQEMILVAFFLLILVEIRLLCIQHSRKRKVEVMAVNFSFAECHLWNSYGSAE